METEQLELQETVSQHMHQVTSLMNKLAREKNKSLDSIQLLVSSLYQTVSLVEASSGEFGF